MITGFMGSCYPGYLHICMYPPPPRENPEKLRALSGGRGGGQSTRDRSYLWSLWPRYELCFLLLHNIWHCLLLTELKQDTRNDAAPSVYSPRTIYKQTINVRPSIKVGFTGRSRGLLQPVFGPNIYQKGHFYALGLKGPLGHPVIGSSFRLSVHNSVPITNKLQYLKFGWWYSNQTWTVSSSMGFSHFIDSTCPLGGVG